MNGLPNFSNIKNVTDDDIEQALEKTGGKGGKYLEEGIHEVEVAEVDLSQMCKGDDTWINSKITFVSVGNKMTHTYLKIPTKDILFGEKKTGFPLLLFKEFIAALQIDKPLPFVFSNIETILNQLPGKAIKINVGYQKNHYIIRYAGSDKYIVVNPQGKTIQENGEDIVFPSKDAAKAELMQNKMTPIAEYTNVLAFSPSKEKNHFKFIEEKKKTAWG